mmetsp:Transcript_8033/g.14262  ORF Transcript_8033/g.14262 Transcript_8033/m.14262 type:complete len:202 (-) Transcript_8033:885-1490(-)
MVSFLACKSCSLASNCWSFASCSCSSFARSSWSFASSCSSILCRIASVSSADFSCSAAGPAAASKRVLEEAICAMSVAALFKSSMCLRRASLARRIMSCLHFAMLPRFACTIRHWARNSKANSKQGTHGVSVRGFSVRSDVNCSTMKGSCRSKVHISTSVMTGMESSSRLLGMLVSPRAASFSFSPRNLCIVACFVFSNSA